MVKVHKVQGCETFFFRSEVYTYLCSDSDSQECCKLWETYFQKLDVPKICTR